MKRNNACRFLTCLGWTAALSLPGCLAPVVATSAIVTSMDEPPCYMRTKDGRIVNLQSLCSHTPAQQTQTSPATNRQPQGTVMPQAIQTQGNAPLLPQRDPLGSHARGNPDSDDGNY
ncbi:MAG: hypothetical protein ACAF41_02585 [Leptolyngbya sp. BL-A-14]